MTVIAYKHGVMAADKMGYYEGPVRKVTKIFKVDGCLLGFAGSAVESNRLLAWAKDGMKPTKFPVPAGSNVATMLRVTPEGTIQLFDFCGLPQLIEDDFIAIGCGGIIAETAMYLGRSAEQAVLITCERNPFCGLGLDVLHSK